MNLLNVTQEPWFPKFLILHSEDQNCPLEKISPFVTAKALEQLIGKSYEAKKLRTGDIQVLVQTKQQSAALQSLKKIGDAAVSVTAHRTLNIVKGVISVDELLPCSDTEIEEGLQDQGVVLAKRIVMRREGKEIPTKHVVLSFQLHTLPSSLKAGYINCQVRAYVPSPRRCFKCQHFGHSSQTCRGHATCPKCAEKDHTPEPCQSNVKCVNCRGEHPVYSRSCPRFQEEKQILKIKTEQNITYKAAKTQLEFQKKGTFSEVVRRGVAPLGVSVETQTPGPPLHTPQRKERATEVSSQAGQTASPNGTATTSSEVAGSPSVWDEITSYPSQAITMEVDDDDRSSQKSSSSLPAGSSQGKDKREKSGGRGRGKHKEQQKIPPPRIQAP
ncbi:uncharacterized protein LOC135388138 [Ornithodoros turicata]|uniref:uncharacterized protein LOC135388138 n=1 Tax=Ornithodoros turicata TaxID=34597 RepID=UPI0031398AE0